MNTDNQASANSLSNANTNATNSKTNSKTSTKKRLFTLVASTVFAAAGLVALNHVAFAADEKEKTETVETKEVKTETTTHEGTHEATHEAAHETAHHEGGEKEEVVPNSGPQLSKKPATRYSGRTPIDLSNGIAWSNGTYGLPNAGYESWATSPLVEPGLSEKTYSFAEKADFISGCQESATFIDHAIWNWQRTPREEVKPMAKEAEEKMRPLLDKLTAAIEKADKSNKNDWESAQSEARNALVEARATYSSFHKNVH